MNSGVRRATYINGTFTKPEATAKLGKLVHLSADFRQLVEGARGRVVDFHETPDGRFQVVVSWNSRKSPEPLYDCFSKRTYHQFITED